MTVRMSHLSVGDKVNYDPGHGHPENGIVKEIRENNIEAVFVVYNCAGDWKNYQKYTSALTNLRDLNKGWFGI